MQNHLGADASSANFARHWCCLWSQRRASWALAVDDRILPILAALELLHLRLWKSISAPWPTSWSSVVPRNWSLYACYNTCIVYPYTLQPCLCNHVIHILYHSYAHICSVYGCTCKPHLQTLQLETYIAYVRSCAAHTWYTVACLSHCIHSVSAM